MFKTRKKQMEELAKSLGLDFQAKDELAKLSWWKRGYVRSWNIISGSYAGKEVSIFDHQKIGMPLKGGRMWFQLIAHWIVPFRDWSVLALSDTENQTSRCTVVNGRFYPYKISTKIIKDLIEGKEVSRIRMMLTIRWGAFCLIQVFGAILAYSLYTYLKYDHPVADIVTMFAVVVPVSIIVGFLCGTSGNLSLSLRKNTVSEV